MVNNLWLVFFIMFLLAYLCFTVRSLVMYVVFVEVSMLILLLGLCVSLGVYNIGGSLLGLGLVACEASFALCLLVALVGNNNISSGLSGGLYSF